MVRKTSRRIVRAAMMGGITFLSGLTFATPQITPANGPYLNGNTQELGHPHGQDEEPFATREMQERQLKRLREEHQKQMYNDTSELLRLASHLKAEVVNSDTPTPSALRDVDEIGKLARRVSERIKTQ
jgi:hypothetical protein